MYPKRERVLWWVVTLGVAAATVSGDEAKPACAEEGFVSIFDGKTMAGWDVFYIAPEREVPRPDAFVVQDGAFYCKGYKDYWLRYKAEKLDDFVLRLEFKLSQGANSGICIRTQDEGIPWQTGFEVQLLDDYGKDPDVHTTGSIYDVITPMYNASRPLGKWNEMEITCAGKVVRIAVNGLKLIDADFGRLTMPLGKFKTPYSELPTTGYVTIQDHGMELWLRNIRLKKLDAEAVHRATATRACDEASGFETILDGQGLEGWSVYNPKGGEVSGDEWVVMEDFVRCRGGKGGTYLRYEKEPLGDCVVRGEFRVAKGTNSGIVLRSAETGHPCYTGFEVQLLDDAGKRPTRRGCGAIYDVVTPMFNASRPAGQWNRFEITTDGLLVKVVLNGWKVIDTDFGKLTAPRGKFKFAYSDLPKRGYVCFQDHGGQVDFRDIQIKRINR